MGDVRNKCMYVYLHRSFRHIVMGSSLLLSAVAKRLEGKVALITGGAGALGAATAKLFREHGAKVVIVDINSPVGDATSFVHCDIMNEPDIENAVEKVVSMHSKLDIMFNNAGIMGTVESDILSCGGSDFERVLRVNVGGALLGTKHAARVMKGGDAIINTGSVCAVVGGVAMHAYTSSKHAVLGQTRNSAVELGRYGIRVNCVSPYVFSSPMSRFLLEAMDDIVKSNLEGNRLHPVDVAQTILFLASDESRCVTGHNLIVDRGSLL